ncbi:hypothetical protein DFJ77DRAFT_38942 [Powellomyces hirtus]|nr:hypothetical protein DFJ77DRAFT_38942 [Powellomyces hirtus]
MALYYDMRGRLRLHAGRYFPFTPKQNQKDNTDPTQKHDLYAKTEPKDKRDPTEKHDLYAKTEPKGKKDPTQKHAVRISQSWIANTSLHGWYTSLHGSVSLIDVGDPASSPSSGSRVISGKKHLLLTSHDKCLTKLLGLAHCLLVICGAVAAILNKPVT